MIFVASVYIHIALPIVLVNENSDILSRNDWSLLSSYRPHSTFVKLIMKGPATTEAFFYELQLFRQVMSNIQHVTNVKLKWFHVGVFFTLNVPATDVKIPLILQVFQHPVT